jgi:uncharacterized membrane protein
MNIRLWFRRAPALLAPFGLLAACITPPEPVRVTLLFDPGVMSLATDVNASGVVVGFRSADVWGPGGAWRAAPGRTPELLDRPTAGATGTSYAQGINRGGVIAGQRNLAAVLWYPDGRSVTLPEPTLTPDAPPTAATIATDLNDSGLVVGGLSGGDSGGSVPVVWEPDAGRATVLETPACGECPYGQLEAGATAVNNRGQIIGDLSAADGSRLPIIWNRTGAGWGPPEPLPVPADTRMAFARDLNDAGTIVGSVELAASGNWATLAVLWSGPQYTRSLITPPGGASTGAEATAINNAGVVVGRLSDTSLGLFRWRPGEPAAQELPGLGGPSVPYAIGDGGTIVGTASWDFFLRAARWDS